MADHWAVTVSRNGEHVVTIEPECLAGREPSPEDERAIMTAAHNLLCFVGADLSKPGWEIFQTEPA